MFCHDLECLAHRLPTHAFILPHRRSGVHVTKIDDHFVLSLYDVHMGRCMIVRVDAYHKPVSPQYCWHGVVRSLLPKRPRIPVGHERRPGVWIDTALQHCELHRA